jgi:hypothetical protein
MNEIAFTLSLAFILCLAILSAARRCRHGTGRRTPCLESGLEPLEYRIAPAALTAKLSGGVLFITGDSAVNTINVVDLSGSIEVLDGGTSVGKFDNVKSIKMNVQGGGLVNVNLSNAGIPGSITATTAGVTIFTLVAGSTVNGGLSLKGDTTAQTLILDPGVVIGKSLTFNGAEGADSFTIGDGTSIGGSATFISVEDGDFNTTTSSTTINGALRFKNTSTPLPVQINTNGNNGLNVSGKVTYAGGTSDDVLFLAGTFGNSASFVDNSGNNGFAFGMNSTVHGSIKMVTGDGNDGLGLQSGTYDGNVSLKIGNGNNTFAYGVAGSVTVGGNIFMITGAGNDEWRTSGGGLTLSGNATMNLGDGTNKIIANAIVNGSKISINTGSGVDTVAFDGSATNAAVRIFLGAGNDSLAGVLLRDSASAIFNGGDGTDHFFENTLTTDPLIIIGFEDFT